MIELSNSYRAALESGAEQNIRLVFENGEMLDKAQISATGGFRYRQILNDDGDVVMGRAIQSTVEVELLNIDGYLDGFNFDSEFTVQYGVKTGAYYLYVDIGKFKGGKASRIKSKTIMLTGADRMRLFDVDASEFIENVQDSFPMGVMDLLQELCDYVGIEMEYFGLDSSVLYRTINTNPFTSYNHTCRQILEWLMESMCKYAVITPGGKLTGIFYRETGITVPTSRRFEMSQSEFITPRIDAIEIYTSYSDRLVSSGAGENLYVISDNPFLYAENDDDANDLQYAADGLLFALQKLPAYPPASFRALTDPSIECGDIIDVVGDDGLTHTFPVMMRTITWSGVGKTEYECTGNEKRETVPVAQRELENLKKQMLKTADLNTAIDSYINTEEGKASIIQTVSGEFVKADDLGKYATTAQLTQAVNKLGAEISLEAAYGSGTIGSNVRAMLTLFANADSSNIRLKADAIDLSGYVTVTALNTPGATTIDGANVTTDNLYVRKIYGTKGADADYEDIAIISSAGRNIAIGNGGTTGLATNLTIWANNISFASKNTTQLYTEYLVISTVESDYVIDGISYRYPCCIYPYNVNGSSATWEIGNEDYPFGKIYLDNSLYLYDRDIEGWARIYSNNNHLYFVDAGGDRTTLV